MLTNVFGSQNRTCFLLNQRTAFNVNSAGAFIQASLAHSKTCRALETLQNRWMLLLLSFTQISLVCVCPAPDTFFSLLSLLTGRQEPWQLLMVRVKKKSWAWYSSAAERTPIIGPILQSIPARAGFMASLAFTAKLF